MKKLLTLSILFSLSLFLSIPVIAQNNVKMEPVNKDFKKKEMKKDTTVVNSLKEELIIWDNSRPTIQLFYLMTTPNLYDKIHKDYQNPFLGEFAQGNAGEIALGTVSQNFIYPAHHIADYDFNGIFFKYMGPNDIMEQEVQNDQYNLKLIQFGFTSSSGYGYQSATNWLGIYLYTGSGIHWSDISYTRDEADKSSDEALNTFDGSMRFGQKWESGLRFSILGPLNIVGGYEQNMIYPRHLFWKWAVSGVIEAVGVGALGAFSDWIMTKSPEAGPVVNWALKTAAYFVLYKLRTENMNWPYTTAPPLVLDSWKLGLSLEF